MSSMDDRVFDIIQNVNSFDIKPLMNIIEWWYVGGFVESCNENNVWFYYVE